MDEVLLQKLSESMSGGNTVQNTWVQVTSCEHERWDEKVPWRTHAEGLDGYFEQFVGTAENWEAIAFRRTVTSMSPVLERYL